MLGYKPAYTAPHTLDDIAHSLSRNDSKNHSTPFKKSKEL
jgi:hypothetical protein